MSTITDEYKAKYEALKVAIRDSVDSRFNDFKDGEDIAECFTALIADLDKLSC